MSDQLRQAIQPKSDQLNADDLIAGPITITITGVRVSPGEQPVVISYEGDKGKPYKPSKGMTRVMVLLWGDDEREWSGKRLTLYRNPEVKWGGVKVGGIQISHASGIKGDVQIAVTMSKGNKQPIKIGKLPDAPARQLAPTQTSAAAIDVAPYRASLAACAARGMAELRQGWGDLPAEIRAAIDPTGCPADLKEIAKAADAAAAPGGE